MTDQRDQKEQSREKPKSLWNTALKAVRGDDSKELVEQFTGEMTLVAEGLYEDQRKLRQTVADLRNHIELVEQQLRNEMEVLDISLEEHHRDTLHSLNEIKRRLELLEGRMKSGAKEKNKGILRGWMGGAILLAAIICGSWVLVTVLQLLK